MLIFKPTQGIKGMGEDYMDVDPLKRVRALSIAGR
jgi:hypothetical protein